MAGTHRIAVAASAGPAAARSTAGGPQRPAAYAFSSTARSSGPTPQRLLTLADLATTANRAITVDMSVGKPGSVYLNRYASAGSFPLGNVRACLRAQNGPACTPATVPNPAYWPVSAADLQHTASYQLVVAVAPATSALLGLHVGWDGPGRATVGGLRLPGGCTGKTGYKAGCGMRSHLTLGAGGPVTLSSATAGLKAVIKDKTTGAKLASQVLRGSLTVTMPAGHEWVMHLLPDLGAAVGSVSLSISWP
ncbi:MAG: hypothetical protein NVSMB55_03210 [Mycobacteriales bacterium]